MDGHLGHDEPNSHEVAACPPPILCHSALLTPKKFKPRESHNRIMAPPAFDRVKLLIDNYYFITIITMPWGSFWRQVGLGFMGFRATGSMAFHHEGSARPCRNET